MMPHHGVTPHISGASLSAQTCYANGRREILESMYDETPIRDEYLIVEGGKLARQRGALLQRDGPTPGQVRRETPGWPMMMPSGNPAATCRGRRAWSPIDIAGRTE